MGSPSIFTLDACSGGYALCPGVARAKMILRGRRLCQANVLGRRTWEKHGGPKIFFAENNFLSKQSSSSSSAAVSASSSEKEAAYVQQCCFSKGSIDTGSCRRLAILRANVRAATVKSSNMGMTVEVKGNQELLVLLQLVPEYIRQKLLVHEELEELLEIVLDLGRRPLARFVSGDWFISHDIVAYADLEHAVSLVGEFTNDNRAGMDRTLHRVSAIRNREGRIVGLTCRVGRAITGSAEMARDLVASGGSLLLMGPPGVGKTTAIREVARMLANEYNKRVVIVDTSNEIGGDGDIPHPGIGRARRMQVPQTEMQHEVMIEAVENHMPQTIIIDEIGTELEAFAAGTISQRGVQLVGTAHGMTVENLIKNSSLNLLAGGVQSVTLGDEEARRRGVQKSVLERKGPPTFTAAVEMISRNEWHVHRNLAAAVDALLAGRSPRIEIRKMSQADELTIRSGSMLEEWENPLFRASPPSNATVDDNYEDDIVEDEEDGSAGALQSLRNSKQMEGDVDTPLILYTHQVALESLKQVLDVMGLKESVLVTNDIGIADVVLALRSKLKSNDWVWGMAKIRQLPIFAIKANTMAQMVRAMRTIFQIDSLAPTTLLASHGSPEARGTAVESADGQGSNRKLTSEDEIDALEEARLAIEQFVIPQGQPVELLPRTPEVIALQIKLVDGYHLRTEKSGTHLNGRLRILPAESSSSLERDSMENDSDDESSSFSCPEVSGDGGTSVTMLPRLPE